MLAWLAGLAIPTFSLVHPQPAMALAYQQASSTNAVDIFSTMTAKPKTTKAGAKDTEGRFEFASGDGSGAVEHQIKGNAKQAQPAAMNTGEDSKPETKSIAKTIGNATD